VITSDYILPPEALSQRVLTIYGDRGWNESDPPYTQSSIRRGYAGLNAQIQRLIADNPAIGLQGVTISTALCPDGIRDRPNGFVLRMFAAVLYTGPAPDVSGLNRANSDPREGNFDDSFVGYGTMIEVYL
jgi:hypothetical protein